MQKTEMQLFQLNNFFQTCIYSKTSYLASASFLQRRFDSAKISSKDFLIKKFYLIKKFLIFIMVLRRDILEFQN
ncbi:hypothetical protein T09_2566 [Trichinella sp. T9]|uniref:Uncharacterized protein n=1 Tax=Trichinella murrelli TaxID=144512 RepID=A0A0V0U985_9BILA|nr:hypothetical protein T05_15110 [Trichinella murrelli]KRX63413.1 hypothetical protein T09_2566 [Trichinella sp. T9]